MSQLLKCTSILLLLSALVSSSFGQSKADKAYDRFEFFQAISLYKKELVKEDTSYNALAHLARASYFIKKYNDAEDYFALAASYYSNKDSTLFLEYGRVLKNNNKIPQARYQFQKFVDRYPNILLGKLLLRSTEEIGLWIEQSDNFQIFNLSAFNTERSEFCPVPYDRGLVFTSNRDADLVNDDFFEQTGEPFFSVYYAPFVSGDTTSFEDADYFSPKLHTDYHDGPIAFNSDYSKIYFSRVGASASRNKTNRVRIYQADLFKGKVKNIEPLPFLDHKHSYAHPYVSPDGSRLYFSSDINGGYGGMDIWYSEIGDDGFGIPKNLGPKINSSGNELFPYLRKDDELFYSSNGSVGFGGLDLFVSNYKDNSWTDHQNLKDPINSPKDDFGIVFLNDSVGYFSSNRDGGLGRDDIYGFIQIDEFNNKNGTEIAGVFEFNGLPLDGATLELVDVNGNVVGVTTTDVLGNFKFAKLKADEKYLVRIADGQDYEGDSRLYLVDEFGIRKLLAEQVSNNGFVFRALPVEEFAALPTIEANDEVQISVGSVFGQVFTVLPGDYNTVLEILALDDQGNFLASAYTDKNGEFEFDGLPMDRRVVFQAKTEQDSLRVAYGERDYKRDTIDFINGKFGLPASAFVRIQRLSYRPTALLAIGQEPVANSTVTLSNADGTVIRTTQTDSLGRLAIDDLLPNQTYFLDIESERTKLDPNANFYLLNKENLKSRILDRISANRFLLKMLPSNEMADLEALSLEDSTFVNQAYRGQVYRKLPGDYRKAMAIYALDENGNILDVAYTNNLGQFEFSELPEDQKVLFRLAEEDNLNLVLLGEDGEVIRQIQRFQNGLFSFEKLSSDEIVELEKMVVDDIRIERTNVKGQIFKKLPGDYNDRLTVYAVNDQGIIIDSAEVDESGGFIFKRLPRDQSYNLQLSEATDDLTINLLDAENGVVESGKSGADGFEFRKLQFALSDGIVYESEQDFIDKQTTEYRGMLYKKLPGDLNNDLPIYLVDDQGVVIDSTYADDQGNFKFKKLPANQDYFVQLPEAYQDVTLELTDELGNVTDTIKVQQSAVLLPKANLPQITYASNARNSKPIETETIEAKSSTGVVSNKIVKTTSSDYLIYFGFDNANLVNNATEELNRIISYLKRHPKESLLIISHTDSKGPKSYNRNLSDKRTQSVMNYLLDSGVNEARIFGKGMGEDSLANECKDGVWCPASKHKENRRSEFKFFKP